MACCHHHDHVFTKQENDVDELGVAGVCIGAAEDSGMSPMESGRGRASPETVDVMSTAEHPVVKHGDILNSIKLVRLKEFVKLQTPLHRCQDLPEECFGVPALDGVVFAVSHAWRNQAHPDPNGSKFEIVSQILQEVEQGALSLPTGPSSLVSRDVYVFFDFISISQPPFRPDQPARTPMQETRFKEAVGCMHNMYLLADRVIHLDLHDESIQGEGEVYCLSACKLRGASFAKFGDWIQILKVVAIDGDAETAQFHRVVAIDGVIVHSVDDLCRIGEDDDARSVKLMRYPYGRVNNIPADERGWIFLERFITAVKCGMLDEESAAQVVVTRSPLIRSQIYTCASQLRRAAHKKDKSHLEKILKDCLEELAHKRFSSASTDKMIDSGEGVNPDRAVVEGIMQGFVLNLCQNWEKEATRQRRRAHTLALQAASKYLLEFTEFSPTQVQRLKQAASMHPWPLLALVLFPPCPALCFLLPAFASPSEGWQAQVLFFSVAFVDVILIAYYFPSMLIASANLPTSRALEVKVLVWSTVCGAATILLTISLAGGLNIWPVPFVPLIGVVVVNVGLLGLWRIIPKKVRRSPDVKRRMFASVFMLYTLLAVFGVVFPILNMLLASTSSTWIQALIVLAFVICKVLYEMLGAKVATILGADAMPNVIFMASFVYEANLCIALGSGFDWLVFIELVLFDFIENMYCLYTLSKSIGEASREAKDMFIAATLVLRECIEVISSCTFLLHVTLVWYVQPQMNHLLCRLTDDEFRCMILYSAIGLMIGICVSTFTYVVMRRKGFMPFALLRGLAREYKRVFIVGPAAVWIYYWSLWHTNLGADLTLRFRWLRDPESHWECGLAWSSS